MKKLHTGLVFVLGIVLCSCAARETTMEDGRGISRAGRLSMRTEMESSTYVIRREDKIELSVWGYPEFTTSAIVKETGTIVVPLVGEVPAAGLTKEQFTEQMRQKLSEYIQGEAKLTISVLSSMTQEIAVLGSVARPDRYEAMAAVSLIEILATAGGMTAASDLRHIKIFRYGQSKQPIEVDLSWYMENGNIEAMPMVLPGDTVFVPRRENLVREISAYLRDVFFLFGIFRIF